MIFADAFRETVFRFQLTGTEIAEKSGVSAPQVSEFRNGKANLRIDNVERILAALTEEQRDYLLNLVARELTDKGSSILSPRTKSLNEED